MIQHKFTGLGVAMVTPMAADESIDFPSLERLTRRLCNSEADFLVVLGSTGEAQLLSEEERTAVLDFVLEISEGAKPIVAGLDVTGGTRVVEERLRTICPVRLDWLTFFSRSIAPPSCRSLPTMYHHAQV
jgi:dihydrodipicolinate synthase/N-acetylneuraminate lyase